MSEPKTPNLALNQIDRSSPATTYFDLDRYLDQNWSKVDDFAGEIKDQVDEVTSKADGLKERLDTEQRKSVTLKPGLQVIEAERASAFRLEGLKGRTLVNLLGRDGGFEGYNNWAIGAMSASLDTTTYAEGSTSSLKVTLASENSNINRTVTTVIGKKYVLIADVKNVTSERAYVSIHALVDGNKVTSDSFGTSFASFTATAAAHTIAVVGSGSPGQIFNVDNVRLYEVSADEYAALGSMTPKQVSAKYPYTEMITGVKNPYAIRYGQNLLPPFYEWVKSGNIQIDTPYDATITATGTTQEYLQYDLDTIVVGKEYTITGANVRVVDLTNLVILAFTGNTLSSQTFTVPESCEYLRILVSNAIKAPIGTGDIVTAAGTYRAQNIMLNIGTTALPFVPREDAMFALQTDLHANPNSGTNPDMLFEKDGQYFKQAKWKKIALNGKLISDRISSGIGYKIVCYKGFEPAAKYDALFVTKYNGAVLNKNGNMDTSDNAFFPSADLSEFWVSVSNIDSGWGDSYTPTSDEIKAYFMGWKMYDSTQSSYQSVYNGGGGKAWVCIGWLLGTAAEANTTFLPTSMSVGFTPYQLLYQIATPIIEPITSEGQLTFFEGDNQIEVGTGLVVREETKPQLNNSQDNYTINTAFGFGDLSTQLSYKVDRFMNVYRNSKLDYQWSDNTYAPFGKVRKAILKDKFDPSAAYSVTYLMLAKYPAANFDGTYSQNEKALLLDTIKSIQENTTRISVLESKRAEKDAPVWITPTLLNGWVTFGSTFQTAQFYKDSIGIVHFRGFVKSGNVTSVIFILPEGYRPRGTTIAMPVVSAGDSAGMGISSGTLNIQPNGQVQAAVNVKNGFLTLEGISFLAEQ